MILTWRAAAAALIGGALALLVSPSAVSLLLVNAALLVMIALDVLLAAPPSGVGARRSGDRKARLGETAEVAMLLSNESGRTLRGWVRDAWPPTAGARIAGAGSRPDRVPVSLRPGERVRLVTEVTPRRRGDRSSSHVAVRTVGPLRLAGRQGTVDAPWSVRTLPPFTSRKLLPSRLARLRDIDGRTVVNARGEGTEFDSLREYVPGDDVRSIDWRATARARDVMLRTWRPERDRRILLVLDCGRTSAARIGDETRLDVAIDAALLMVALGTRAGDRVDVLAYDRGVRAEAGGSGTADLLPRVVDALTPVEPSLVEMDAAGLTGQILARARKHALIILFTGLERPVMEEGLLPTLGSLTRRHTVLIASITDGSLSELAADRSDVAATYRAASAAESLTDRAAVASRLARLGCVVVDRAPGDLAAGVADTYLDLKASGRL